MSNMNWYYSNYKKVLSHTKDNIDILGQSGVFRLTCNGCNTAYIEKQATKLKTFNKFKFGQF